MGGVGKTSLARTYAQQHLNDYGIVWWIRAEDPATIDAEFRTLLEVLLPPGEAVQTNDARAKAFTLLAQQKDPWLLVLDNVPDAASVQSLLPPAGNGHVLITSRATEFPAPRTVEPLHTDAAVNLLLNRSGDTDRDAAKTLAVELGGLPLALTQAASFVRTNAIDLATYLRLYRDRSAELHAEGRPADYPYTIATTWQLAIDQLTMPAREMLNILAFYAPDAIPVKLLFSEMDELARIRAIGELRAYSLITPAGRDLVTVHRLVQAVTRSSLDETAKQECTHQARKLIEAAWPTQPVTAISLATWNSLHTHVHALLDHLPTEHPYTLITRHNLAYWTGEAGDPARARDLLAELLPIMERILGTEHPDILTTRHELARWTGNAGDPVRARDLFAELLPIQERVRGTEHPHTLTTRHELARWTGNAGDPVRARDLLAELLPIQERVRGAEHPDTLGNRHNLAFWTGDAGDPVRARDLFAELLPIQERVLGAEHPDTLTTRHNLARWTGNAGDPVRARDLFAELLPIDERVLGTEHPSTLIARHNLAYWTGKAGDAARARDLFAELLPIRERVLGAGHPNTLTTRRELEQLAGLVEEAGPGGGGEG